MRDEKNAEANKGSILLVEDDPVSVAIVKKRLSQERYKVIVAKDGLEGIHLARTEMPDLILMDMILPRMHGLEATIRLKNDPKTKNIPIFAVTALSSSEFVQACYQDGICVFVKKPYEFKELLDNIEKFLQDNKKAKRKILIVNEDPALVTLIAAYLKEFGNKVISAPPRMVNVNHLRKIKPDVIFLDISMLKDAALTVFSIIKNSSCTKSIPVILMASQLLPEELEELALQLGAEDFIPHLFQFEEVDRKIRDALEK